MKTFYLSFDVKNFGMFILSVKLVCVVLKNTEIGQFYFNAVQLCFMYGSYHCMFKFRFFLISIFIVIITSDSFFQF